MGKQIFGGMKGMKNRLGRVEVLGLFLIMGLTLFAGCAAPSGTTTPTQTTTATPTPTPAAVTPPSETSPAATPAAATFPMTITDQLGRVVTINKMPQRIISLAPGNTEILFALGLGDKVVGVDQYSDYPAEAKTKPVIGGFSTPNFEKVVTANPDLILAANIHQATVIPYLEKYYTVVALDPKTVDEVLDSITLVGKIIGKQAEAANVDAGLSTRIKAVTDKTANLTSDQRPRVFYVVWPNPLMSAGNSTFQSDLIQKAGGANIAQSLNGWATISTETVVAANPQILITDDQSMAGGGTNFQFIKTDPSLANTAARKNGLIYTVNTELISHPGPRLVDALEQFAKLIHPELFK